MSHALARRVADQALQLVLTAALVVAVVLGVMVAGPEIESRARPVLDVSASSLDDGVRLRVTVQGRKLRSCELLSTSYAWQLNDRQMMPTAIADAAGAPTDVPDMPVGPYSAGPFYALVPASVRLSSAPALLVTFYYRCNPLWVTVQSVVTSAVLAPPAPLTAPAAN